MHVGALRTAALILLTGASLALAMGTARAERAEGELEAPAADGVQAQDVTRQKPTASRRRARRELQEQRREAWWIHAREVLFAGLELDAQQVRGVDAIIEEQLRHRAHFQELDAQFAAALRRGDKESSAALDAELRAASAQLKEHQALFEEMRALLREEQRPTFDTNRARLVAEGQAARRARREARGAE